MNQEPASDSGVTEYFEGYQQLEMEGIEENLKKTRNAIFVVAALAMLGGLLLYFSNSIGIEDLYFNFGLSVVYLVLGLLTKKFPMACIVSALILFAATWALNIYVGGGSQVFQGIIVKAIIIYWLVKGIGYAREAEELRKRMNAR